MSDFQSEKERENYKAAIEAQIEKSIKQTEDKVKRYKLIYKIIIEGKN